MTIEEKINIALKRLDAAIKIFKPIEVFGTYSGGHDSFSACYIASLHPKFSGVVHINTGIGIEATRDHVREACREKGWNLLEYKATENTKSDGSPDPQIYEEWVNKYGFPGPKCHTDMYTRLKQRSIERLERDLGATARKTNPRLVLYVGGARSDESDRRMRTVAGDAYKESKRVWANIIHDWTKLDTTELIKFTNSKRNPVVDLIHKSGECLCGAFANPGELEELNMWDITRPAYKRITELQNRVMEKFPWGWEDTPPKAYIEEKRGQEFMEPMKQMLCWRCINHKVPI